MWKNKLGEWVDKCEEFVEELLDEAEEFVEDRVDDWEEFVDQLKQFANEVEEFLNQFVDELEESLVALGKDRAAARRRRKAAREVVTHQIQSRPTSKSIAQAADSLTENFNGLQASLDALETCLSDRSRELTPQTRQVVEENATDVRNAMEKAIKELRYTAKRCKEISNGSKSFDFLVSSVIVRSFNKRIDKYKAELHHANAVLIDAYTLVATESGPPRHPHPLMREAALTADRIVNPVPFKVFISHAGEDKDTIAIPLWNKLRDRGIDAFVDKRELPVGGDAPEFMKDAMASAPVGVFILSPEFAAKKWTMMELLTFQNRADKAASKNQRAPMLIPLFYRLSVSDCTDHNLLWRRDSEGRNPFVDLGFSMRATHGYISPADVMRSLGKLAKQTGIENQEKATNKDSDETKRDRLVELLAEKIDGALRSC